MGSKFEGTEGPSARVVRGFEQFLPFLQQLSQQIAPQFGQAFGAPQLATGDIAGKLQSALGGAGGLTASVLPAAQQQFLGGLQTGFAPDIMQGVEAQLLPALERSFGRGSEAIRAQAANLGTLTSSDTTRQLADMRGGLESGLLQQLAGLQGQLGLGSQGIRSNLALAGLGLPFQTAGAFTPLLAEALGQSRFGAQQPLSALQALSQGISSIPTFTPEAGPSKFSQVTSGLGNIMGGIGSMGQGVGSKGKMMGIP